MKIVQYSFPKAFCVDCVAPSPMRPVGEKSKKSKECRTEGVEKMGSLAFLPYSQSEIFEAEATIDGSVYFFP